MSAKVFVPQVPSRFDSGIGAWVPIVDLSPARRYGEIVTILPPGAYRMDPKALEQVIGSALDGISANDWILAAGDPAIMGMTMAMAAFRLGGALRVLRWNKQVHKYDEVVISLKTKQEAA